jgi:hypothetical protein
MPQGRLNRGSFSERRLRDLVPDRDRARRASALPCHELVLGGVVVSTEVGFNTHSDGDVLSHALIDAPAARARARDHQHLLESATPAERPLAPAQRRRHKPGGVVAVAIARELAAYCCEIATLTPHPDPVPPASLPAGDPLT